MIKKSEKLKKLKKLLIKIEELGFEFHNIWVTHKDAGGAGINEDSRKSDFTKVDIQNAIDRQIAYHEILEKKFECVRLRYYMNEEYLKDDVSIQTLYKDGWEMICDITSRDGSMSDSCICKVDLYEITGEGIMWTYGYMWVSRLMGPMP